MHKLKKLQEQYKKGELTKALYLEAVKALLTDDYIDQEEHDEAVGFNPEDGKAIYTQADVDSFIAKKAVSMVRKALKDKGVEVEAGNKDILATVADLVKAGQAGDGGKATDKDLERLKALEAKQPGLEAKIKDLTISNAVIVTAGKHNPYNAAQVVRALRLDYMGLVEIDDETGAVDIKSVERAIARIKAAEPNLFKTGDTEDDKGDDGYQDDGTFKGKGPGGGAGGEGAKDKLHNANLAKAREMLGLEAKK
jgi:hypothetical protein